MKKEKTLDQRLEEIHRGLCKGKQDHQLMQTLFEKEKVDDGYYKVNTQEIFNRQKN